jgi:hypothetical protein
MSNGAEVARPHSALTRFLKQGLARGICPLCRVAHKLDAEYMWHFFDEYSGQDRALDELRRSCGFCREHADTLRRIEVDGLRSTLGISKVYLDTLEGIAAELEALAAGNDVEHAQCPACADREEGVRKNARYLLDELAENERSRQLFVESPGLCMRHFDLVWETIETDERALVLEVQRHSVSVLLDDLKEHIAKHDHRRKGEPKGAETDSWIRAIRLTAGWRAGEPDAPSEATAPESAPPVEID